MTPTEPTDLVPTSFDPRNHFIRVQGGREYLPASARLVWFRHDHPDFGIVTTPVEINLAPLPDMKRPPYAIFKAEIYDAAGKLLATAHKYEDVKGFPDFLEKAETGAVSRALSYLGYGTANATDLDEGTERLADSPVERGRGNAPSDPAAEAVRAMQAFGWVAHEHDFDVTADTDPNRLNRTKVLLLASEVMPRVKNPERWTAQQWHRAEQELPDHAFDRDSRKPSYNASEAAAEDPDTAQAGVPN